jgi:type 1 glutamine amidotransferase
MNEMNRREMLRWSAAFASTIAMGVTLLRAAPAADEKPLKLLFYTKSSSYEHSVIAQKGDKLGFAQQILTDLARPKGFEIVCSKDGGLFAPDKISEFDGFVFYTQGDLSVPGLDKQPPMSVEGKQALLDAIDGGKGFVGMHCASDTFHSKKGPDGKDIIDPYLKMVGGEFIIHGAQQDSTLHIVDPKFPGAPDKDFTIKEEWYSLKNFAPDLHVIGMQQTESMKGKMYDRPPYPSTWAKMHGKGKVFYTSLAHREETWKNPVFTDLLMGGISWAMGKTTAEIAANLDSVMTK